MQPARWLGHLALVFPTGASPHAHCPITVYTMAAAMDPEIRFSVVCFERQNPLTERATPVKLHSRRQRTLHLDPS